MLANDFQTMLYKAVKTSFLKTTWLLVNAMLQDAGIQLEAPAVWMMHALVFCEWREESLMVIWLKAVEVILKMQFVGRCILSILWRCFAICTVRQAQPFVKSSR